MEQSDRHPSFLPASHPSLPTTSPSLQISSQVYFSWSQFHPSTIMQSWHPSWVKSQVSLNSSFWFVQKEQTEIELFVLHFQPGSIWQVDEHPSPDTDFISSHSSNEGSNPNSPQLYIQVLDSSQYPF